MDIFGNFSKLGRSKQDQPISANEELDFSYSESIKNPLGKVEEREVSSLARNLKFVVSLFFIVLFAKLFYLQVVQGGANSKLAEGNRIRPRVVEAPRGLITDKDGVWLARNKPNFVLALYPSDLPRNKEEREAKIKLIAEATGVSAETINDAVIKQGSYSLDPVILKDQLTHEEALIFEEKAIEVSGFSVMLHSSREYEVLPGLAHLLGYTGLVSADEIKDNFNYSMSDWIGKSGLEKEYESYLRGKPGIEQVEVNSRGDIVRVLVAEGNRQPVSGNDISLYLDRFLQAETAKALQAGIEAAGKVTNTEVISGAAIVMDVKTGGILSMVSLPDYNNNLFANKISSGDYQKLAEDKNQPLFNRAIGGVYPPGSISKIILASAGLSEGTISPNTFLDTPPAIQIGEYSFPDWKDHGVTDIIRAIAESNNIFFYAIGGGYDKIRGIGIEKIKHYWELFGLGEKTGIDLPGESAGFLPDAEWKKRYRGEPWYIGDTYHVSIGQGDLLVTPLQMLRATAVIANGGKLLRPRLIEKVASPNGDVVGKFGSEIEEENFLPLSVLKTVARGMRLAVTDGSARRLADLPVTAAGKTGTAQFFNNQKTHAWFEAYAPYENPEIAVVVLIEGGGGGNETAVPVAFDILNYYFSR